jgi:hypothetical protein
MATCGVWLVQPQALARRSIASAKANSRCHGQSDAMAMITRRTLVRPKAPILRVPHRAL